MSGVFLQICSWEVYLERHALGKFDLRSKFEFKVNDPWLVGFWLPWQRQTANQKFRAHGVLRNHISTMYTKYEDDGTLWYSVLVVLSFGQSAASLGYHSNYIFFIFFLKNPFDLNFNIVFSFHMLNCKTTSKMDIEKLGNDMWIAPLRRGLKLW